MTSLSHGETPRSVGDGGVADVLHLDRVDGVLGDALGLVADTLEAAGDENKFQIPSNGIGIFLNSFSAWN